MSYDGLVLNEFGRFTSSAVVADFINSNNADLTVAQASSGIVVGTPADPYQITPTRSGIWMVSVLFTGHYDNDQPIQALFNVRESNMSTPVMKLDIPIGSTAPSIQNVAAAGIFAIDLDNYGAGIQVSYGYVDQPPTVGSANLTVTVARLRDLVPAS